MKATTLIGLLLMLTTVWPAQAVTTTTGLKRDTMGGIGRLAGGDYRLDSTLGQPAPGYASYDAGMLHAGFWTPGGSPRRPRYLYLPLAMRGDLPPLVVVPDAPAACPGYPVEAGRRYRDDFDAANDNDRYTFTAQAGLTYTLRTFDLGAEADTLMALYAPDCVTLIVENDDSGRPDDKSSLIVWVAPAGGDYHVVVRHYDWRVYGPATGYTFEVVTWTAGVGATGAQGGAGLPGKPAPYPTPQAAE